jgi:hypothetical protein
VDRIDGAAYHSVLDINPLSVFLLPVRKRRLVHLITNLVPLALNPVLLLDPMVRSLRPEVVIFFGFGIKRLLLAESNESVVLR